MCPIFQGVSRVPMGEDARTCIHQRQHARPLEERRPRSSSTLPSAEPRCWPGMYMQNGGQNGGQITRQTKAEARLVLASLVEMGGSRTQTHLCMVVQDRSAPQQKSGFGRPFCSRSFRIVQRCGGQNGGQNLHRHLAISFAPLACDHWYRAMFTHPY